MVGGFFLILRGSQVRSFRSWSFSRHNFLVGIHWDSGEMKAFKRTWWWFQRYVLFSSRTLGEWCNLTSIFSDGLVQPPTSEGFQFLRWFMAPVFNKCNQIPFRVCWRNHWTNQQMFVRWQIKSNRWINKWPNQYKSMMFPQVSIVLGFIL